MESKTKLILIVGGLTFVAVLIAIYISFTNRQKQLEAEKNAAIINNNNGNQQPTVVGTALSVIQLAIAALREKKKKENPASTGAVTGTELKSYLANSGVSKSELGGFDVDMLANTTWNGSETYGG